jgi:hypothetical protein
VGASIPKLTEHQKIIWLLKTRQQRDKQLKRLRNARGISVQVVVVGRAADDNKDNEENDLFLDAALQLEVNQQLLHFDEALRELKDQLSAYTGPSDMNTPEGQVWRAQSENMQHIAVAQYAAKLQIWEYVLMKINVFCVAVECFLQIQSDTSMLSKVFAPWDIALAIRDEEHQVDLQSAFVVCLRAQTVCVFGDQPRYIVLFRWGNHLASEHIASLGDSYCWQQACYGGTFTDLRECLRNEDCWKMQVSWRFGLEVCRFLREASAGFGGQGTPLLFPLDCPSEYTTDELTRIPDAKTKWVMYSGLWYYASPGRGKLEARAQLLSTSMTEAGVSSARVAASIAMFVNLAREALCFFSWVDGGAAKLNQHSSNFEAVDVTVAIVFSI